MPGFARDHQVGLEYTVRFVLNQNKKTETKGTEELALV